MSTPRPTTFLLEVGTEEIPDRMLTTGVAGLRDKLAAALEPLQILAPGASWSTWCTPRRLTVAVGPVLPRQEDRDEEVTGPPVRAALDAEGKPTKALEGFARGYGLTPDQVQRVQTPKGEYMGFRRTVTGRPAAELLAEAVAEVLRIRRALGLCRPGESEAHGDGGEDRVFHAYLPLQWLAVRVSRRRVRT